MSETLHAGREFGFHTRAVHAGARPEPGTGARAVPIYQTSSYVFEDPESAAAYFNLQEYGNSRDLVIHPASTTHRQLADEELAAAGIGPGTIRLSIGIEDPEDLVDVFRAPAAVPAIAEDAVAIGAAALWLQFGVISPAGAALAARAGLDVVMDRCFKIEHARHLGRMHVLGFNTGVVSCPPGGALGGRHSCEPLASSSNRALEPSSPTYAQTRTPKIRAGSGTC
ncbi:MAG: PLP-dependent transferase [Gammaproteobacteria bacterium]|nr:PLP-dependent transferase [Gammaproteobacteria bacterium]